ncbi:MAG TPA: hypothetical protein VFT34_00215 [Verrucomicrobiae bacterium]|nr:hypothetical protein [Verrucomicrobiae bacterium]
MNSKLFQPPVRTDAALPVTLALPRNRSAELPLGASQVSNRAEQELGAPSRFGAGQRGVALVVTLILLVVITTLAVAFLALSHRETIAVSGSGSTLVTEYAADAALERAKAQSLAQIAARNTFPGLRFGTNNDLMGPDLMVSVCGDTNRAPWNGNGSLGMIINPSPPVFIWTNKAINDKSAVDDRSWLDLNRNRRFEPTGFVPDEDDNGNRLPTVQWRVGDPQWIGILRDPTLPHGPDNPFIARYAYLILPAGRSLDINWIHNEAIYPSQFDGYFRNQGVGAWEMNLAAFLADVNPNYWNSDNYGLYSYFANANPQNERGRGAAFADAKELLNYRFPGFEFDPLRRVFGSCRPYFASNALWLNVFSADSIDLYCNGPVAPFGSSAVTATNWDGELPDGAWPGSRSAKNFFTVHDLWKVTAVDRDPTAANPNPTPSGFVRRLKAASARGNTEDRYTFYRILAQLDTDSTPERDDRLNINYRNLTNDFANPTRPIAESPTNYSRSALATNIEPWNATEFFHAAADRLLTNEFFPDGRTNIGFNQAQGRLGIPVWTNGSAFINGNPKASPIYTPRVHQLLQMTLNIFEATRRDERQGTWATTWPRRPTVMRPLFSWETDPMTGSMGIFITNYVEETDNANLVTDLLPGGRMSWRELDRAPQPLGRNDIFNDIPILFGARKGIPCFNEFTIQTHGQLTRKLEVRRNPTTGNLESTNRLLTVSLSNYFRCEFFNPYSKFPNISNAYPRPLQMYVQILSTNYLTNSFGLLTNVGVPAQVPRLLGSLSWSNGYELSPLVTNAAVPSSAFYAGPPSRFEPIVNNNVSSFELIRRPLTDRWGLVVSNRVLCLLFEADGLVDCFSSARMTTVLDINGELDGNPLLQANRLEQQWRTRPSTAPFTENLTEGERYQMDVSRGLEGIPPAGWQNYGLLEGSGFPTVTAAITGFDSFLKTNDPTRSAAQAPFSPSRRFVQVTSWEANDPLVHYTISDLYDFDASGAANTEVNRLQPSETYNPTNYTGTKSSLGRVNRRYRPWGGQQQSVSTDPSEFQPAERDPGVYSADDWDFPTQKFPNLGWLGRVHRGTPWQTIYLKAADPTYDYVDGWKAHTGAAYTPLTIPMNDWRLLDVFTAAVHPNATRGRLSINQTNLAAWSSVFAGLPVTQMVPDTTLGEYVRAETNIQPASTDLLNGAPNVPLLRLVEGINRWRTNQFTHLSQFMAVPELTISSPFLHDDATRRSFLYKATDSDYERLPQQILSLVKLGEPRYVVYSWGQSLKPADYVPGIGIGVDAGTKLTRNYQITGELATRAVVRVEFERNPLTGQSLFNRPHAVVENFNILPNE